jgi:hypothetical protein
MLALKPFNLIQNPVSMRRLVLGLAPVFKAPTTSRRTKCSLSPPSFAKKTTFLSLGQGLPSRKGAASLGSYATVRSHKTLRAVNLPHKTLSLQGRCLGTFLCSNKRYGETFRSALAHIAALRPAPAAHESDTAGGRSGYRSTLRACRRRR